MNEQKKINIVLIALFAVLIVAIFVIVLDPTKKSNQFVYNGFVVSRFRVPSAPDVVFHSIDFYVGNQQYNIPLRNNPEDIESITASGLNDVAWLQSSKESSNYDILAENIFITFDPDKLIGADVIIAGGEIIRVLGSGSGGVFQKQVSGAFTHAINGSSTPVKECKDADKATGVIMLVLGNENKVYSQDDCVIVEGQTYFDLIRSADRFLLALLGVIES
jgi:hypothetical protein